MVDHEADERSGPFDHVPGGAIWTALIEHRFAYLALWDALSWMRRHRAGHLDPLRPPGRQPSTGAAWSPPLPMVIGVQLAVGHLAGPVRRPLAPRLLRGDRGAAAVGDRRGRGAVPRRPPAAVGADQRAGRRRSSSPSWAWPRVRYGWRLLIERRKRPERRGHRPGARVRRRRGGAAGDHRHAPRPGQPVPAGRHRRRRPPQGAASGCGASPVRGTARDIAGVAEEHGGARSCSSPSRPPTAPWSASWPTLGDEAGPAGDGACPPVRDLFDANIGVSDIRPLTTADLLGRREIDTDIAGIAGYLTGRRVLVTGRRRLDRLGAVPPGAPLRPGRAGDARPRRVAASTPCSSPSRAGPCSTPATSWWPTSATASGMAEVFAEHRPEVVFHAAALKHLPLLRDAPERGGEDERVGHASACSSWPLDARRRHVRQHLHRQGGRPRQRARLHQAHRRAPHRRRRPTQPTGTSSRCASATCSAAAAACSARSGPRSSWAGRSPSPTPTSPATS